MSEKYPYPEREHIESPASLLEMIERQTDIFATCESSSEEVQYLTLLYGERPLAQGAMYLAGLTRVTVMSNQDLASPQDIENCHTNFFAGAVTAIHTNLYPQSKDRRDRILSFDPLRPLKDRTMPEEHKGLLLQGLANDMVDWHVMNGLHSFESQSKELKERILELSIAVYKEVKNPQGQDTVFINGYMFLSELIWNASKAYDRHPRGFLPKV